MKIALAIAARAGRIARAVLRLEALHRGPGLQSVLPFASHIRAQSVASTSTWPRPSEEACLASKPQTGHRIVSLGCTFASAERFAFCFRPQPLRESSGLFAGRSGAPPFRSTIADEDDGVTAYVIHSAHVSALVLGSGNAKFVLESMTGRGAPRDPRGGRRASWAKLARCRCRAPDRRRRSARG